MPCYPVSLRTKALSDSGVGNGGCDSPLWSLLWGNTLGNTEGPLVPAILPAQVLEPSGLVEAFLGALCSSASPLPSAPSLLPHRCWFCGCFQKTPVPESPSSSLLGENPLNNNHLSKLAKGAPPQKKERNENLVFWYIIQISFNYS